MQDTFQNFSKSVDNVLKRAPFAPDTLDYKKLKINVCSLDDKVKIFGGLIGYNYLAKKFNDEDNSNLPIIPSEKLEKEMIIQQNEEISEIIKKNKEED